MLNFIQFVTPCQSLEKIDDLLPRKRQDRQEGMWANGQTDPIL